jgi:hypothetical protein
MASAGRSAFLVFGERFDFAVAGFSADSAVTNGKKANVAPKAIATSKIPLARFTAATRLGGVRRDGDILDTPRRL